MWKKVELKPKEGLFLMNNGLYIYPDKNISKEDKDKIIGYCLDDYRVTSINSSKDIIPWSKRHDKIPGLTDYEYEDGSYKPYRDLDGKYNTNCIVNYCRINNIGLRYYYPATYYCKSFNPGYKNGEWYLPSIGELKLLYDKRNKFRKLCHLIGIETNMSYDNLGACYFWSSTEYSKDNSWYLHFNYSNPSVWNDMYSNYYVVPFLSFKL